jgi:hypothetical protein
MARRCIRVLSCRSARHGAACGEMIDNWHNGDRCSTRRRWPTLSTNRVRREWRRLSAGPHSRRRRPEAAITCNVRPTIDDREVDRNKSKIAICQPRSAIKLPANNGISWRLSERLLSGRHFRRLECILNSAGRIRVQSVQPWDSGSRGALAACLRCRGYAHMRPTDALMPYLCGHRSKSDGQRPESVS